MADDDKDFDSVDAGIAPKITPLAAGFAKRQKLEDAEKAEQKKIQKAKQITVYPSAAQYPFCLRPAISPHQPYGAILTRVRLPRVTESSRGLYALF